MFRHAIDTINNQIITGWCYSRALPSKAITLSIYSVKKSGQELIGKVLSNEFRQDLLDLSVHPTGKCGFTFSFPKKFQLKPGHSLKICTRPLFPYVLASYEYNEVAQVSKEERSPIIFMHIPKTAGTSFNAYAGQFFQEGASITHIEDLPENQINALEKNKNYQYIAGHLPLGRLTNLYPPEYYTYYTIIRDPMKQLHSHLNWIKGIGADPTSGFYKKHPQVIQQLATGLNKAEKHIKDTLHAFVQNLDGFERDFFDNIQTRYFLDYRPERVTSKEVQAAKENCSLFRGIGTTEHYEKFTKKFCYENGLNYIEQPQPLNRSKQKSLYNLESPEIKEILFPLVKSDMALYKYICSSS